MEAFRIPKGKTFGLLHRIGGFSRQIKKSALLGLGAVKFFPPVLTDYFHHPR
jgi:hypothetical protein